MITMPRWLTASGVRDWLLQRVTAVILLAYLVVLVNFFASIEEISYISWKQLFSQGYFVALTLATIASLLLHTWVGLWTVITDYMPSKAQKIASLCLFLTLAGLFTWSCVILTY